ncbi:sensor histidine kinase [Actinomadura viridis]|uniref:histidine kinase n=1 Tax=Actinomadura viridis TaxID=58110 RepID=A0A931DIL2_9ACTN|nr:sensor histidine kinase [Actinomadura viridis]MBG6087630.1 signal transduction histidine kinase [Actinomadura viridis]
MRAPTWAPRGRSADAILAVAMFVAVAAVTTLTPSTGAGRDMVPGLEWVLTVVACGALYWRRAHPSAVLWTTMVAAGLYYPVSEPDGPLMLTFVFALYNAAARGRVLASALGAAAALALVAYGEIRSDVNHLEDAALWLLAGWFVAVVAVGGVVHNRLAYLREAERRAAAAEHGREEEARRRATEERLRIAREVHDVLGHNISLINVQASAALHAGESDRSTAALEAIKQASKETLRELRTTLGVLRQVDEPAPTGPAPGISRLPELTGRATAAGPAVRTEIEGEPRPLPPETDLAVYRIVQEALTNVTRHSDAASVLIRVRYTGPEVVVRIEDDGRPVPARTAGTGSGIEGMRDRAEALGGTFEAGPGEDGGFRVRVVLPVASARVRPEM